MSELRLAFVPHLTEEQYGQLFENHPHLKELSYFKRFCQALHYYYEITENITEHTLTANNGEKRLLDSTYQVEMSLKKSDSANLVHKVLEFPEKLLFSDDIDSYGIILPVDQITEVPFASKEGGVE